MVHVLSLPPVSHCDGSRFPAPLHWSSQHACVCIFVQELAAYKDGAMANAVDAASRTPLFYAHSPAAIEALLDAGADVNARDCDGLDCVAFRITETMALDTDKFDLSVKDQACPSQLLRLQPPTSDSRSHQRGGASWGGITGCVV